MLQKLYYQLKPLLPRRLQLMLRRQRIALKQMRCNNVWPIYHTDNYSGDSSNYWPDNKQFALIMTHDVDTERGQKRCQQLLQLEQTYGIVSGYYFVPERYTVIPEIQQQIRSQGFEVGVHGLNHDGQLYLSHSTFNKRSQRINYYIQQWGASGFGSPAMQHKLHWLHDLDILYDISTYDTDPFEPQGGGLGTILPFCVYNQQRDAYFVEIPYTLPQDFTILILMQNGIDIWREKLDWIVAQGGMVHVRTHPDYMNFNDARASGVEEYSAELYAQLLQYITTRYRGMYWNVTPRELASYWSKQGPTEQNLLKEPAIACNHCRPLFREQRITRFPLCQQKPKPELSTIKKVPNL